MQNIDLTAKMNEISRTKNLRTSKPETDQEKIKQLQKQLEESQSNTKRRHHQAFQLSCELKQERDKLTRLAKQLSTEQEAKKKSLEQIKDLNMALLFANNSLNDSVEYLKNIVDTRETQHSGNGDQMKTNFEYDGLELNSNPLLVLENKFKILKGIHESQILKVIKQAETETWKWKTSFLSLVNKLKEGSLLKKKFEEAKQNLPKRHHSTEFLPERIPRDLANESDVLPNQISNQAARLSYAEVLSLSPKPMIQQSSQKENGYQSSQVPNNGSLTNKNPMVTDFKNIDNQPIAYLISNHHKR